MSPSTGPSSLPSVGSNLLITSPSNYDSETRHVSTQADMLEDRHALLDNDTTLPGTVVVPDGQQSTMRSTVYTSNMTGSQKAAPPNSSRESNCFACIYVDRYH